MGNITQNVVILLVNCPYKGIKHYACVRCMYLLWLSHDLLSITGNSSLGFEREKGLEV